MPRGLTSQINTFFENNQQKSHQLFVVRDDGVVLYSSTQEEKSAVGALMGAAFRATQELSKCLHIHGEDERLFFETHGEGLSLFPLKVRGKSYIFGGVYHHNNPGKSRYQLKSLCQKLEEFLLLGKEESPNLNPLFNDITDAEMDKLFPSVR